MMPECPQNQQREHQQQWQYSGEKLPTGRIHDWPMQGICSAPVAEGDRLWFVSNRGEVVCLDAQGFNDGENAGPHNDEPNENRDEADVVWAFDMMKQLGVRQHNLATCAPTIWGDVLFVCTSNGVDESHVKIPAPDAPSFIAMDKRTGKLLWTDNSPGTNILHGQWSCPIVGVFAGVPVKLGTHGIEEILEIELVPEEAAALTRSAELVGELVQKMHSKAAA